MSGTGGSAGGAGAGVGFLANILGPIFANQQTQIGLRNAGNALNSAYGQSQGYLQQGYQQAQQGLGMGYQAATSAQQPYYQAGTGAMQQFVGQAENGFQAPDFKTDPGYQFRLQQGQGQIANQASAAGNQQSGATSEALARYNQNFASNEYNNVYNRALGTYQTNMQNLGAAGSVGQGAANQLGSYGMNYGGTLAQLGMGYGSQAANYSQTFGENQAGLAVARGNANAGMVSGIQSGLSNTQGTQNMITDVVNLASLV
jgi:hypothetical protein